MNNRTVRPALTEAQKGIVRRMLKGDELAMSDGGQWELGDPPSRVRPSTVKSLLRKGAVRLGIGHCTLTSAGAEAGGGMTLDMAIQSAAEEAPDKFARQYAGSAGKAADEGGTRGLVSQVRYILANVRSWRGERARMAKAAMRAWLRRHG